jgi:YD repeat-containing protein
MSCDGPADKPSRVEYPTHSVEYAYDKRGRKTVEKKFVNGTTLTTHYEYDASGNLVSQTDPKGQTTRFEYDLRDQLVKKIRPMGETTTYSYDESGNLVEKFAPEGHRSLTAKIKKIL